MTKIANARELGGYRTADGRRVKRGCLLRSAKLSTGTAEDFSRLLEDCHLKTVVDFRMEKEVREDPDPEFSDVRYRVLSILKRDQFEERGEEFEAVLERPMDEVSRLEQMVCAIKAGIISDGMYEVFLAGEAGKEGFRGFFEELLRLPGDGSLLFHCTQGKDRTGLGAMLLLSVLGVDRDTILADYMLTNGFCADMIRRDRERLSSILPEGESIEPYMIIMNQVSETTLEKGLSFLEREYGSAVGYVREELGMGEAEIRALQHKFLEGAYG